MDNPHIIIMREGTKVTIGHHGNLIAESDFDLDESADAYVAGVRDVAKVMGYDVTEA